MGLFDKVKSIKNAITGGAAKVYVDSGTITFGEPFEITVRAQAQDADVKYDRVYLKLEGVESAEIPDVDVVYNSEGEGEPRREIVSAETTTFEMEVTVAPAGVLEANQSGEWTTQIELPQTATPTFKGKFAEHYYRAFAGLDCFGNDPDSGWVRLNVSS